MLLWLGPILLTLLISAVIYGGRWLSGQYVFTGVIQEQYYILGQFSFDHLILEEFGEGLFPLWNQYNALGTPLLANMLSAVFYPLKALVYAWPGLFSRDIYIVLRLIIAALFAYGLMRELKLSYLAALVGSVSFAFTGYMKMFVNENYLNADVLLPGLVLFTLRLIRRPRLRDVVVLGFLVFCVINNGHPEAALYALLLPALVAVSVPSGWRDSGKSLLLFGGSFAIGLLLSLPMLLGFVEYWFRGYHFHLPGAGFFHYPVSQLAGMVTPWFFGQVPAGAPFLSSPGLEWAETISGIPSYAATSVPWLCPAVGTVTLFLAVLGMTGLKRLGRTETVMTGYAVFFTAVMFGLPLFNLLGFVPLFDYSGNFKHPLPGVALCLAVLAGGGIQSVLDGRTRWVRVANTLAVFVVALLFLGALREPLPGGAPFFNKWSLAVLAVTLLSGVWLSFAAMSLHKSRGDTAGDALTRGVTGMILLLAVTFTLIIDGFWQPMRDVDYMKSMDSAQMEKLAHAAPPERAYISQDIAPPNLNILFGVPDIRVMDGVNDRRFVKAINRINGHDRTAAGTYWYREVGYLQPKPDNIGHPLMELFSVKYALMRGPLPYNRTISELIKEADITAPGPGYAGMSRMPLRDGMAPAFLQHPPSRVEWRHAGEETEDGQLPYDYFLVRLKASVVPEAIGKQPDGAWLMFSDGHILGYARHLHPASHPSDLAGGAVEMEVDCELFPASCEKITLMSLPGPSSDFDQVGWADFRAGESEDFYPGPWEMVGSGRHWLYRNPGAFPRAFLAGSAIHAPEEQALDMIASKEINPGNTVVISGGGPLNGNTARVRGLPGRVTSVSVGSQKIEVDMELWDPGWLVLSDLYYPGWKCRTNGEELRVRRGDFCLRSVPVDAGRISAVFTYEPASFRTGLFSAIGTLLGLLALIATGFARRP